MIVYLSILVCVAGLVIFFAAKTNAKVERMGFAMFWVGLLAFFLVGGPMLNVLHR